MNKGVVMSISAYFCHVLGECPQRAAAWHASTVRRAQAFAIALHIPVLLWLLTGYLVSVAVFQMPALPAGLTALFFAGLIYLVERIVLATPKVWYVGLARVCIGLVMSVLGASTVDLVVFDREITGQLQLDAETKLLAEHDQRIQTQGQVVAQVKTDWVAAQEAANCEANGTCGSKVRSTGPVYRELSHQAQTLRREYGVAQDHLQLLTERKAQALAQWRDQPLQTEKAGLLARLQALHAYTAHNLAALLAWGLFFLLVFFFEMTVVLAKMVFGETVDDELERMREQISAIRARDYMAAVTSPVAPARHLLAST